MQFATVKVRFKHAMKTIVSTDEEHQNFFRTYSDFSCYYVFLSTRFYWELEQMGELICHALG